MSPVEAAEILAGIGVMLIGAGVLAWICGGGASENHIAPPPGNSDHRTLSDFGYVEGEDDADPSGEYPFQ